MSRDRAEFFKGMHLTGAPGPTAPPPFSRRDLVKKGDFLINDSGSVVLPGAKIRTTPAPSLADIKKRLDALRKGWSS